MRASYLELYNEELFDLLGATECDTKMRIYEDASRKVLLELFCIKVVDIKLI